MRVLSWNEKDQKFQLSLSGGAFPKGKENLLRVTTGRGEFVGASHHRIFSSERMYRSLAERPACALGVRAYQGLHLTTEELARLSSREDDQHCSQINADLMGRYADEARRYGQRFLTGEGIGQSSSQGQDDAHKLFGKSGISSFLHMGGQAARSLTRNHPYQLSCQKQTMDCVSPLAVPAADAANLSFSSPFERISRSLIEVPLSLMMFACHRIAGLFDPLFPFLNLSRALQPPKELKPVNILAVSVEEVKSAYYDMQVLETNNYVCEHGFIHHNSGKSRAGTMRLLLLMAENPGINTLYALPTYDLLRLRALPGFEDDLQAIGLGYQVNKSEWSIHIPKLKGSIYLRSYDNPNRFIAFEVAHAVADEIDTLPKDKAEIVWRKISERTRQACNGPNTIGVVTTPDQGVTGFVYQKWAKQQQSGYEIIKARTTDNPFLPDGYVQQIRDNYDPVLADLYLNGEFVSLSHDKVYHFFSRKRHHTDRVIKDEDKILYVGLDFNIGGCCAVTFIIENGNPVAVDEFVSHDTYDVVNNLKFRYKDKKVVLFPDASGKASRTNASQSDIQILESGGFMVDAPEQNPAVRDRINAVNALLSHDKLAINTDKCQEFAFSFESQGYTDKGEPEKFNDHPAIDDWCDAAGYFVNRKYPVVKPVIVTGIGSAM